MNPQIGDISKNGSLGGFFFLKRGCQVSRPDLIFGTGRSFGEDLPAKIIGKDGATMVLIPAGTFLMGDSFGAGEDDELPVHEVYLDDFYIDVYEVTNTQYKKFIDDTGHRAPSHWSNRTYPDGKGGHPVSGVSWSDAAAYAAWVGERLPTEAEWEKAARGGLVGKKYPWGDDISHENANYEGTCGRDVWKETSPVGSFPSNGYGLYDMTGNVWEWCADWYDSNYYIYYIRSPEQNPKGPDYDRNKTYNRVLRGGAWRYGVPSTLRVAARDGSSPDEMHIYNGFRCAASPSE